ncbi:5-hydroxytryptamine receptor 2B-like, partial [Amphibalanus amphitrite]|uniref:5-hydroxytryptamine receptor 2B-like n=1 Tax=Amphibalanus amphitrite TaxID=1232801 RepID=UPI001C91BCBE
MAVTAESDPLSTIMATTLSSIVSNTSNSSETTSGDEEDPAWGLVAMITTSCILGVVILTTVIGNVFVIAAIVMEKGLQNVANYLIVSLAVADLMVACLVMPLGAMYESYDHIISAAGALLLPAGDRRPAAERPSALPDLRAAPLPDWA